MNFLNFLRKRTTRFLITSLSLLFLINILVSSSVSSTKVKKSEDQTIVFLDISSCANILIDNTKPDKRIIDKTNVPENIRNYLDNSFNIVFNKYYSLIKNNLSKSISSRPFITVVYSTDI